MRALFSKLWADDSGVVAIEYLLVATIVSLGAVAGLGALRAAINSEFFELASAIGTLSQNFSYAGASSCSGFVEGSQFTGDIITANNGTIINATAINSVDVSVCP